MTLNIKYLLIMFLLLLGRPLFGVTLTINNQTNNKVNFGYAYYANATDKWTSIGWWSAEAQNSRQITVPSGTPIYAFASSGGYTKGRVWGGTVPFCGSSSAFSIPLSNSTASSGAGACGSGGHRVWGLKMTTDSSGNMTWNLHESGIISSHFNLCNTTTDKVWFSRAQYEVSSWTSRGWGAIEPGACTERRVYRNDDTHPGSTDPFLVFGKSSGERYLWEGSYGFCISRNSAHVIVSATTVACDGSDEGKVAMIRMDAAPGIQRFDFSTSNRSLGSTYVNICNNMSTPTSTALAYYDALNGNWVSKGWYNRGAGACGQVKIPRLDKNSNNYYIFGYAGAMYQYSSDGDGNLWVDEDWSFCTTSAAFEIPGYSCTSDQTENSFQVLDVDPGINSLNLNASSAKTDSYVEWCNPNEYKIYVAYMAERSYGYKNHASHGWYLVESGQCRKLRIRRLTNNMPYSGKLWWHAQSADSLWNWGSGTNFCVETPSAFSYSNADTMACNIGGQIHVSSNQINLSGGTTRITLNESSALAPTYAEICNDTDVDTWTGIGWNILRDGPNGSLKGVRTSAWYTVAPGACNLIPLLRYNGYPYEGDVFTVSHADRVQGGESRRIHWTGSEALCLVNGGTSDNSRESCINGSQYNFTNNGSVTSGTSKTVRIIPADSDVSTAKFCNDSGVDFATTAIGYKEESGEIRSINLGALAAGSCVTKTLRYSSNYPFAGDLYYYARDVNGSLYSAGSQRMCIGPDGSDITSSVSSCSGEGYQVVTVGTTSVISTTAVSEVNPTTPIELTKLQLCNYTTDELKATVTYYAGESQGMLTRGWFQLSPDLCEKLDIFTESGEKFNGPVFVFGKQGNTELGEGPMQFCVDLVSDVFELIDSDTDDCNNSRLKKVDATPFIVDESSSNIFEFNIPTEAETAQVTF